MAEEISRRPEPIDATQLKALLAKQIDLAFHDSKPTISLKEGAEMQKPINASAVAFELTSLDWTKNLGILEGKPRDGSKGIWKGNVSENGFIFINRGAESPNKLKVVDCRLPRAEGNYAGLLRVVTEKAVLRYKGTLVEPKS